METSHTSQRTYAVLGVGAVGGLYGGLLAKAGFDVHFLARSDSDFMRANGLRVESIWGDFALPRLNVYSKCEEMPKVDCVLVAWKATSNDELAKVLPAICNPETTVMMIQNGLDIERSAADVVGKSRVLGACSFLCCNKVGPGHIAHLDYGKLVFGDYNQSSSQVGTKTLEIHSDFQLAGIPAETTSDLRFVRWKKLAWNIPFNGLSVALNADTAQIMHQEDSRWLAEQLMWEVVKSAAACGVSIPDEDVEHHLEYTRNMIPYASSMLLDYQNRRPLELDAIFATPIRAAKQAGYTPVRIEMLYHQLAFLDWKNRSL